MTFSCTMAASGECNQLLIPSSGPTLTTEQSNCKETGGTSGTGCSTSGIVGCCQPLSSDASHSEQCYYQAAAEVSIYQAACTHTGHTWSTTT
jgi:hypothetical protein